MSSISPTIEPGWSIEVVRDGENGPVERVVYTADEPVADGLRATVTLGVQYGADAGGQTLAFPVTQVCEGGETAWVEIAEDGQDTHELEAPAPTVAVAAASEEGSDAHGHAASEQAGADGSATTEGSGLPVLLGAGGLVLGAAALVVAIAALRRGRA